MLDGALVEQVETGLEVGDFGVEFFFICSCFLNVLDVGGFCEGLGSNWGSEEADSSGYFHQRVVLVDGEGSDDFFD